MKHLLWLVPLTLAACVASVAFGARDVAVADVLAAFGGATDTPGQAAAYLRIPRTVLAVVVGAGLGVAGLGLQAVTRNPLADPGIFGLLSGAALAVVIGIAFTGLSGQIPTMLTAILGAGIAAVFVYLIGSLGPGGPTPLKLALAGAATTAALSSATSAILLPRVDVMDSYRFWQIGSVGGASWPQLGIGVPAIMVGFVLCLLMVTGMNALALGDETAQGLGTNVAVVRGVSALGAVILAGTATAMAGPIGFVGLIIPHVCRLLVGTDHRVLLPISAVVGSLILVLSDTIGRVIIRPEEVAVGVLMPLIGAPVFIWILRRQKVREL